MTALEAVASWPVPTAAAAVIGPSGVVDTIGPVDEPFWLASVTKPLAALAVLVAVEEEAVSLDDPADPELLPGATLRHLLAHASGLNEDNVRTGPTDIPPLRRARVVAPPGTRRIYTNAAIEQAARLVEAGTGMPFGDYFSEAVVRPLGLTATTLDGSAGHGGRASVADLARVVAELLRPTGFLAAETLADLRTVQYPGLRGVLPGYGPQAENDWGLGFEIRAHKQPHWTGAGNSPSTYGHFGQRGTFVWIDPVADLALVALTDRPFGPWAIDAWPALADAVLAEHR
ncbi:MAG: serine hydrolase domain-containing protein [Jatrophihabitans sp.]|uniref:serine hydrolase domain-containing protein n=1 Tax=Jatrophihabitans sp. TaxID=1932789 RepID=UPI003F7D68AD